MHGIAKHWAMNFTYIISVDIITVIFKYKESEFRQG